MVPEGVYIFIARHFWNWKDMIYCRNFDLIPVIPAHGYYWIANFYLVFSRCSLATVSGPILIKNIF